MRKSALCLSLLAIGLAGLGLMFIHAAYQSRVDVPAISRVARVVRVLELTDLSLFTEARYTRHPSQADLQSAFQDHPACLEHFPSGSLAAPPPALRRLNGKLD